MNGFFEKNHEETRMNPTSSWGVIQRTDNTLQSNVRISCLSMSMRLTGSKAMRLQTAETADLLATEDTSLTRQGPVKGAFVDQPDDSGFGSLTW